jgi:DNA-directed RNA polymerase subunit delta
MELSMPAIASELDITNDEHMELFLPYTRYPDPDLSEDAVFDPRDYENIGAALDDDDEDFDDDDEDFDDDDDLDDEDDDLDDEDDDLDFEDDDDEDIEDDDFDDDDD